MASDIPKQFMLLAGRPVLMHTIEAFRRAVPDAKVTVVLPEDLFGIWKELCREHAFHEEHLVAAGGATRFESVRKGLETLDRRQKTEDVRRKTEDVRQKTEDVRQRTEDGGQRTEEEGLVAVHDGVRPLIREETILRLFGEAALYGSAVPVVTSADSLRWQEGDKSRVIDRNFVKIIQTPQVFLLNKLREAYVNPYEEGFTDDATVWERGGNEVHLCEGQRDNIKITTREDLGVAEGVMFKQDHR